MDTDYFSYKRRAFDALCTFFRFRMQRSTKRLMNLKCGDEDERYARKAVETLVKKLKKGALEDLEYALNNPKSSSKCVIMQNNMENKQDCLRRQALPHVIYCRIWRWPDLKSYHELRPLEICTCPYTGKGTQTEICINPYHYERSATPPLPPVIIPHKTELRTQRAVVSTEQILSQQNDQSQETQPLPCNITVPREYDEKNTLLTDTEQIIAAMFPYLQSDYPHMEHPLKNDIYNINDLNTATYNNKNCTYWDKSVINLPRHNDKFSNSNYSSDSVISTDASLSSSSTSASSHSSSSSHGSSSYSSTDSSSTSISGISDSSSSTDTISSNSFISNSTLRDFTLKSNERTLPDIHLTEKQNENYCGNRTLRKNTRQRRNDTNKYNSTVYYEEQAYWASISYYELNSRVGDAFLCKYPVITVDGYTSPNDPDNADRMCLGSFSNISRTEVSDHTRKHIGKGIHIHHVANGIILQVFSHTSVFVQSRICNYMHGFNYNTVCKILPGGSLKIFDFMVFANLLSNCVHHGYEAVYELTKMCTIRVSFVKGWGVDYHRQDVTSTPCWIEIHVYGALKWLDNVLSQMDRPANRISSVT